VTIDIAHLYPEKFRTSAFFQAYIDVLEAKLEEVLGEIEGLAELQDPYRVPLAHLQRLADLLGVTLTSGDSATEAQRRRELIQSVDWIKLKGTYHSLDVLALMFNLTFNIYDMYTNDYSTFVDEEWFVGNEGENPSGLDSSYYKSPHFGLAIVLDRVYAAGTYDGVYYNRHLWRIALSTGISSFVERIRPANTVPHYLILLECQTDESGDPYTITSAEVITRVVGNWTYSKIFFDSDYLNSGGDIYFDDGLFFDTSIETFVNSITKWKLGSCSGSGCMDLEGSTPFGGFELDLIGVEGTIDRKTIENDRIVFEFTVPAATALSGVTQVGLYTSLDELMIASTFPEISKSSDMSLKVKVTILRQV